MVGALAVSEPSYQISASGSLSDQITRPKANPDPPVSPGILVNSGPVRRLLPADSKRKIPALEHHFAEVSDHINYLLTSDGVKSNCTTSSKNNTLVMTAPCSPVHPDTLHKPHLAASHTSRLMALHYAAL